jgi:hypothetical protein
MYKEYVIPEETINFFNVSTKKLPPSAFKSLIQKIIRYSNLQPYLNYNDDKFNPDKMLDIVKQS